MSTYISNVPRINIEQNVEVTPTITAGTYTAGFQLGGIMTLNKVVRYESSAQAGTALLTSITVVDTSLANAAIDIYFFKSLPTVASSDHAALNISDAQMQANCIGVVSVGASYSSNATPTNAVSTTSNLNLPVYINPVPSTGAAQSNNGGSGTIYAVAKVTTTTTTAFGSTTGLKFIFNFLVD